MMARVEESATAGTTATARSTRAASATRTATSARRTTTARAAATRARASTQPRPGDLRQRDRRQRRRRRRLPDDAALAKGLALTSAASTATSATPSARTIRPTPRQPGGLAGSRARLVEESWRLPAEQHPVWQRLLRRGAAFPQAPADGAADVRVTSTDFDVVVIAHRAAACLNLDDGFTPKHLCSDVVAASVWRPSAWTRRRERPLQRLAPSDNPTATGPSKW